MISRYETQFMNLAFSVMKTGFYQKNERTGIGTKRLSHGILQCDLEKELPSLTSKKVYWKSAVDEILWIYKLQSNVVADLKSHIWDSWKKEDGTIGKAYGYQIKQFSQVDRVLEELRKDPSSRRAVIDLWQCKDLPEMALTPCVYTSVWDVVDGKLNVLVTSRSCDLLVGGVFNVLQYAILCHLFARDLGLTAGLITFVAADVHIYENQFDAFTKWAKQFKQEIACGQYESIPEHLAERMSSTIENRLREAGHPSEDSDEYKSIMDEYETEFVDRLKKLQEDFIKNVTTEYTDTAKMLCDTKKLEFLAEYNEKNHTNYSPETIPEDIIKENHLDEEFKKIHDDVQVLLDEMISAIHSEEYKAAYNCSPKLVLNNEKTSFYDFTLDDISIEDYKSLGKIEFEVAV